MGACSLFLLSSPYALALYEPEFSQPVKILPLGDSITQAWAYSSYRYPLWVRLLGTGVDVEFLGTLDDTNDLSDPRRPSSYLGRSYDGDHEGHWGWTADEVLRALDRWLDLMETPDITLIHLGTNDSFRKQDDYQTRLEIAEIIERLRLRNPDMLIVVAKIFPGFWADVTPLNDQIAKLAGPGILIADCFTGIDLATDTVDGAHPNASGGEKMAAAWWEVLAPELDPWRQTYVRWEEGYGVSLPEEEDSDADGWMNFLEYAARTNPLDAGSRPAPSWSGGKWVFPEMDLLRTKGSVVRESAARPDGPFLPATDSPGDGPLFMRWSYSALP
jgi:hypothetical protein